MKKERVASSLKGHHVVSVKSTRVKATKVKKHRRDSHTRKAHKRDVPLHYRKHSGKHKKKKFRDATDTVEY
jgi:hypothetical protein